MDSGKEDLENLLTQLAAGPATNGVNHLMDIDGGIKLEDGLGQSDEIPRFTVPVAQEEELTDIPDEMRPIVFAEIAAFRDRSNRRDLERLRQEEEMEAAERQRSLAGSRPSRLASPPVSAPTGPGGANGIPVGPRNSTVQGAPAGPKGYRGVQIPKEYADGVSFVNGFKEEDEDDSASDEELERRRNEKRKSELERAYLEQEHRWLGFEKKHFDSVERQQKMDDKAAAVKASRREELATRLANFDDEAELRKPTSLYYRDRKAWQHERRRTRIEEKRNDDRDRIEEEREKAAEQRRLNKAQGMADDFLAQQAVEIEVARATRAIKPERAAFSLNLGNLGGPKRGDEDIEATKRSNKTTMAEVEGLLDDEEDAAAESTERKPLKLVEFKSLAPGEKMTEEERHEATKQLAASIPAGTKALFAWPVKWEYLPEHVLTDQLRPYVQKKIMESLGVQEDMLVELIEGIVRRHGTAKEIVAELEDTLDEEAESLARKVWRMVVFFSESEARGLST